VRDAATGAPVTRADAARAGQAVRLVFGGRKEAQAVIQGRQGRLL